jgi:hypothetical protein
MSSEELNAKLKKDIEELSNIELPEKVEYEYLPLEEYES